MVNARGGSGLGVNLTECDPESACLFPAVRLLCKFLCKRVTPPCPNCDESCPNCDESCPNCDEFTLGTNPGLRLHAHGTCLGPAEPGRGPVFSPVDGPEDRGAVAVQGGHPHWR